MRSLRELLSATNAVRLVGVYDGLSANLADQMGAQALWASGLCISASKALPDSEVVTYETLVRRLEDIQRGSRLPLLADVNAGFGDWNVFGHVIALMEKRGVDGIAVEDKAFPRHNSFDEGSGQRLEEPEAFAAKVEHAVRARSGDMMLVARTEGFIAGESLERVRARAHLYCDAGADAVIVHSKSREPGEVLAFARAWRRPNPVIVIPTTYPQLSFKVAADAGIGGVICANQLLRASMQAVEDCAARLVTADTIGGLEDSLAPLSSLLDLVGAFEGPPAVRRDG